MIILKSPEQIAQMYAAGRLVAQALETARSMLQPGLSTVEISDAIDNLFTENGATPLLKGLPGETAFPGAACISVNEEISHGVPGRRRLREGDLVTVDTACRLNGWCTDAARTFPLGRIDDEKRTLLSRGEEIFEAVIGRLATADRWSEVASAAEVAGMGGGPVRVKLLQSVVGHGIGRELHEDPQAPLHGGSITALSDFRVQPGLVLAVEFALTAGRPEATRRSDGWTWTAADGSPTVHFEHTIAMLAEGPLVLTKKGSDPISHSANGSNRAGSTRNGV